MLYGIYERGAFIRRVNAAALYQAQVHYNMQELMF